MKRFLLCMLVPCLWFACDDGPVVAPDLGYDAFPLDIGRSWTYRVDSVIYDPNGESPVDTISLQLREVLTDTFTDNSGQLWYRLEAYERPDSLADWSFARIGALGRDATRAFRLENNLELIRYVFPPDPFARWESTAFIDASEPVLIAGEPVEFFKGWESSFLEIDMAHTLLSGLAFDQTSLVSHADFVNLIELRRVEERYARGVGLVSRSWYILDTQVIDGSLPWEEKAEKGFILQQYLIDYE